MEINMLTLTVLVPVMPHGPKRSKSFLFGHFFGAATSYVLPGHALS